MTEASPEVTPASVETASAAANVLADTVPPPVPGETLDAPVEYFGDTKVPKLTLQDEPWLRILIGDRDRVIDEPLIAELNALAESTLPIQRGGRAVADPEQRRKAGAKSVMGRTKTAERDEFYEFFNGAGAAVADLWQDMLDHNVPPIRIIGTTRLIYHYLGPETKKFLGRMTQAYSLSGELVERRVAFLEENEVNVAMALKAAPTLLNRREDTELLESARRVANLQAEREEADAQLRAVAAGSLVLRPNGPPVEEPAQTDPVERLSRITWRSPDELDAALPGVADMPPEVFEKFFAQVTTLVDEAGGKEVSLRPLRQLFAKFPPGKTK